VGTNFLTILPPSCLKAGSLFEVLFPPSPLLGHSHATPEDLHLIYFGVAVYRIRRVSPCFEENCQTSHFFPQSIFFLH